jgi:hypothetical protein
MSIDYIKYITAISSDLLQQFGATNVQPSSTVASSRLKTYTKINSDRVEGSNMKIMQSIFSTANAYVKKINCLFTIKNLMFRIGKKH